jgi:hypothetical protein
MARTERGRDDHAVKVCFDVGTLTLEFGEHAIPEISARNCEILLGKDAAPERD